MHRSDCRRSTTPISPCLGAITPWRWDHCGTLTLTVKQAGLAVVDSARRVFGTAVSVDLCVHCCDSLTQ